MNRLIFGLQVTMSDKSPEGGCTLKRIKQSWPGSDLTTSGTSASPSEQDTATLHSTLSPALPGHSGRRSHAGPVFAVGPGAEQASPLVAVASHWQG